MYDRRNFFLIVANVVSPFLGMAFPGAVVELLQRAQEGMEPIWILFMILGYALLMKLLATALEYAALRQSYSYMMARCTLFPEYSKHTLDMDYEKQESKTFDDLEERSLRCLYRGNDVGIEAFLHQGPILLWNFLGFLLYSGLIWQISPWVFLYMIVSGGFLAALTIWQGRVREKHSDREKALMRASGKALRETLDAAGRNDIILYQAKDWLMKRLNRIVEGLRSYYQSIYRVTLLGGMGSTLLNLLRDLVVYLLLISQIAEGRMTVSQLLLFTGAVSIGSFTQYSSALLIFNQSWSKLLTAEYEIHRMLRNLGQLTSFLERENAMTKGTLPVEKRLDNAYEIEFHDVGFQYPGAEEYALRHVSLHLSMKQRLAVVGTNGAGKSTFIKLLCRLYDPTEGVITLNGMDIRKFRYEEYQRLFGVVFQQVFLFGASIAENTAVSESYEEDRIWQCLKQAGTADFVRSLAQGVHTVIEKGGENGIDLSGGQEQKLAIARALYRDAPFVVLDEPTAALDPISEAEIYEHFREMVQNKTSVYISHRMSSCRFCDEILVFDQGREVERGTHEELLAQNGIYARLWTAQAQYYVSNYA